LDSGFWYLVAGRWPLVAGCRRLLILDAEFSIPEIQRSLEFV
jgi:hypothetical protein